MASEAIVVRKLSYTDAPVRLERSIREPHFYDRFQEDRGENGSRWNRFKTAARELVEDARGAVKRIKKGFEPVSRVEENQVYVPPEVVISQFGPAILVRGRPPQNP